MSSSDPSTPVKPLPLSPLPLAPLLSLSGGVTDEFGQAGSEVDHFSIVSDYIAVRIEGMKGFRAERPDRNTSPIKVSADYNGTLENHKYSEALNNFLIWLHAHDISVCLLSGVTDDSAPCALVEALSGDINTDIKDLKDQKLLFPKPADFEIYRPNFHFEDEATLIAIYGKLQKIEVSDMHALETIGFLKSWDMLSDEQKDRAIKPLVAYHEEVLLELEVMASGALAREAKAFDREAFANSGDDLSLAPDSGKEPPALTA